ncbi:MAG TPA: anaerobic ribonucleoside-triphosphate reductase activating protein [Syntrophorhabdaceae bacterium]|nr:anaerobic ribonucleoside-triphosphate reductase activating protein [Syntrophorhabdaceae bacterium]
MPLKAHNIPIKGFIETSFIDWRGHLSSVLFTGGCNFRCPYCHNSDLVLKHESLDDIPLDFILLRLKKFKRWVDHLVITGGEPTIHKGLEDLIRTFKKQEMSVKLDTNGSNPHMLKRLVYHGMIDYIAMDIKGPIEGYHRWCGTKVDIEKIKESIRFIMEGKIDYEFRMTVVPFLHKEKDIYEVARYISGAKRFYIQNFKPNNTLDPSYMTIKPFPPDKIKEIKDNVAKYIGTGDSSAAL